MVDVQHTQLWIKVLVIATWSVLVDVTKGYLLYPANGKWMCNAGNIIPDVTVRGGIQAGEFKKIGAVGDIKSCVRYCCEDQRCDVAFEAKSTCYLVSCDNAYLCQAVPAQKSDLHPKLVYLSRSARNTPDSRASKALGSPLQNKLQSQQFGDVSDETASFVPPHQGQNINPFGNKDKSVVRNTVNQFDIQASNTLLDKLRHYGNLVPQKTAVEVGGKKNEIGRIDTSKDDTFDLNKSKFKAYRDYVVTSEHCFPAQVHQDVSLKWGTRSGKFSDYGEVGSMNKCVDLCCKDKTCDVAFMIGKICYTVSCSSFELCQMVRKPRGNRLQSQLAYVIKKADKSRKKKLQMSRDHERMLAKQTERQLHAQSTIPSYKYDNDDIVMPKSDISPMEEPNVPSKVTRECKHNTILSNHALIGGQKAGIYTLRGRTPNFQACVGLCCADPACDAAFLLGKSCYSVQCYRDGKCAGRAARSHGLQSKLAFIERKDPQDLSAKRTAIPGLLPTDRRYTVVLNITNEDYKEALRDPESLEFLNFAEALRSAINGLYGNIDGYKYVEVLKFRPNKVIAMFNLTADKSTHPKVLLQVIADALRKGELRTYEEPVSGRMTLDVRGFKFMNNKGQNLVCLPEYNFETHWPLAIYGTAVNVPCPRNAKGLTNRKCVGNDEDKAKWLIPDFSNCVSQKYEDLLREVQLLTSTSIHSPELTTASIVDRLLQMATADTYGPSPPPNYSDSESAASAKSLVKVTPNRNSNQRPHQGQENPSKQIGKVNLKTFYKGNKGSFRQLQQTRQSPAKYSNPRVRHPERQSYLEDLIQANKKVHPRYGTGQQTIGSLKSQGYWSLPHKDNGQESPMKSVSLSRDYPGKMYRTLSLPVSNVIKPAPMKWDLTRHLPTRYPTRSLDGMPASAPIHAVTNIDNEASTANAMTQTHRANPDPIYIAPAPNTPQVFSRTFESSKEQGRAPSANQGPAPGNIGPFSSQLQYSPLGGDVGDVDRNKYLVSIKRKKKDTGVEEKQIKDRTECCPGHDKQTQGFFIFEATSQHSKTKDGFARARRDLKSNLHQLTDSYVYPKGYASKSRGNKVQNQSNMEVDTKISKSKSQSNLRAHDQGLSLLTRREINEDFPERDDIVASLVDDNEYAAFRGIATAAIAEDQKLYASADQKHMLSPSPKVRIIEKAFYKPNVDQRNSPRIQIEEITPKDTLTHADISHNTIQPLKMRIGSHVVERPVIVDISGPVKKVVSGVPPYLKKSNSSAQGTNLQLVANPVGDDHSETEVSSNPARNSNDVVGYTESHLDQPNANAVASTNIHQNGEGKSESFPLKMKADSSSSIEVGTPSQGSVASSPPSTAPKEEGGTVSTPNTPPLSPAEAEPIANKQNPPGEPAPARQEPESAEKPAINTKTPGLSYQNQDESQRAPLPVMKGSDVSDQDTSSPSGAQQQVTDQTTTSSPPIEEPTVASRPEVPQEGAVEVKGSNNQNEGEEPNQFSAAKPKETKEKEQDAKIIAVHVNNASDSTSPPVDTSSVAMTPVDNNESVSSIESGLVANETEEKAYKLGPQAKMEDTMVFSYDKEKGKDPAPMFGGDILIAADIIEEIQKYSQGQTDAPTYQEVKEFLQAVSAILDNRNALEWKNAQRHMKVMASDSDTSYEQMDSTDWRSIHKVKSQRVPDVLMELVSNVEKYGRAVGQLISRFNKPFQKAIITENIVYHVRVIMPEQLGQNLSPDNVVNFPDYKDKRFLTWSKQRDLISMPVFLFSEAFEPTTILHVFFFWFKSVHGLQRFQSEMDERDSQEILDEPSMKLSSQLISMSVEPSLGNNLRLPVTILLQNAENFQAKARHQCAFWNETRDAWSTTGCKLVGINDTHTTCQCDHMTTYGVLVDDSKPQAPPVDETTAPLPPSTSDEKAGEEIKGGGSSTTEVGIAGGATKEAGDKKDEEKTGEGGVEEVPSSSTPPPTKAHAPKKTSQRPQATDSSERSGEDKGKGRTLIILIVVIILLVLLLLMLLICFLCWYRRRRQKEEDARKKHIPDIVVDKPDDDVLQSVLLGYAPDTKKTGPTKDVTGGLGVAGWLALVMTLKFDPGIKKDTTSSSSGSAPRDENLIDKSELEPKGKLKGAPGSASSSRTNSPDPAQSPGWRKLMSHAHHPESMLLKEKALLFADYHQPYNFLSRDQDKPNTSLESVYGSEAPSSLARTVPSDGPVTPGTKRKRPPRSQDRGTRDSHRPRHGPRHGTRAADPAYSSKYGLSSKEPDYGTTRAGVQQPPPGERPRHQAIRPPRERKENEEPAKREEAQMTEKTAPKERNSRQTQAGPGHTKPREQHVMPSNLNESHSMEWDPYLDTKQKEERLKSERKPASGRKKRNISPISEEPVSHEGDQPIASVEPQVGSDHRPTALSPSETSYPISAHDTTIGGMPSETPRVNRRAGGREERVAGDSDSNRGSYSGNSEESESASPPEKRAQRVAQGTDSSGSSRESLPREQEKADTHKGTRAQRRVDR